MEILPVVKAEAYGHGAVEAARVLAAEGARRVAVSNFEEGLALREAGLQVRVLVMADYVGCGRAALVKSGLTPVVHSLEDLKELSRMTQGSSGPVSYHLKIDSGMGRLGLCLCPAKIVSAIRETRNLEIEGLMSHFASAADDASTQTADQIVAFRDVLESFRHAGISPRYVHLSSSGAIAYGRRPPFENAVRPGLALYGYVAGGGREPRQPLVRVSPVLRWKATILAVKEVPEGSPIGYGATFRTARRTRAAVLGVGYADGYPRPLSNRGQVIAGGRFAPILGAVSMDVTTIDVTQSPQLRPGDAVTLLGSEGELELDAMRIARTAGMTPYDLLCGIHPRVKRVYVD